MKKPAILIHGYDPYENPIWKGWQHCFEKYWDWRIPGNIYFLTCLKRLDYEKVFSVPCGEGAFSNRLIKALHMINADVVFYMQDDYWLHAPYNASLFQYHFECLHHYSMDCLHVGPHAVGSRPGGKPLLLEEEEGCPIPKFSKESPWTGMHFPSFWRREKFLEILRAGETAWEAENRGHQRIVESGHFRYFYVQHAFCSAVHRIPRNEHGILDKGGKLRSGYTAKGPRGFNSYGRKVLKCMNLLDKI